MAANEQTKNQKSFLVSLRELETTTTYIEDLEPKQELYLEMSRISEAGYCAGWAVGIEFFLWQAINGGSREFGALAITEQEITHLKTLSQQSGGWWHWNNESKKVVFIPVDEWQEIYRVYLKNNQTNEKI